MALVDLSTAAVNSMLDALTSLNSGTIQGRTGTAPGIGAGVTGTLLFTLSFNATAFGAAASRARLAGAITDANAAATGTLGYCRFITSGAVAVLDIKGGGSWITTFSSSTGLLGTTNVAHAIADDTAVEVYAEGAGVLPTGLAANTTYYARSTAGSALKFALTAGGAAIAFTDAGSGTLRLKLAATGVALQSADGTVAAGIAVGVSAINLRIPNVTL